MERRQFRCVFNAKDYEASVTFYRDGLGLEVVSAWDRGPGDRGTLFRAATGIIEVVSRSGLPGPDAASRQVAPQGVSVMIEIDDVEAFHSHCQAKGLPIDEPLKDLPWGHRRFSLTDPDGLRLQFFSEIE